MIRRLATVLATLVLVITGSLAVAAPASAGELVFTGGGPGGCFTVRQQHDAAGKPQVTVWNTCGEYVAVKVVWKFGPDSGCNRTHVGKFKFSDSSSVTARFDKLVRC